MFLYFFLIIHYLFIYFMLIYYKLHFCCLGRFLNIVLRGPVQRSNIIPRIYFHYLASLNLTTAITLSGHIINSSSQPRISCVSTYTAGFCSICTIENQDKSKNSTEAYFTKKEQTKNIRSSTGYIP